MSVTISGSGQIIKQVVQATKVDTQTVSTSTFTDVTGLSVNITPTNSANKILVFVNLNAGGGSDVYLNVTRNGTSIFQGTGAASKNNTAFGGGNQYIAFSLQTTYLDSPATTSSTTYTVQVAAYAGYTAKVNRRGADDNFSSASSITVMEVAYA